MEFIYTTHFLVTILSLFSMVNREFRVVSGVIFSLNLLNYLVIFLMPSDFYSVRYSYIPILFVMDLMATLILLGIHRKMKDLFSLKVTVVMYFFAITHLLDFISLFIIWSNYDKLISKSWGYIDQLVVVSRMMYTSYDEALFILTAILVILFIRPGIRGMRNVFDYARLFLYNRYISGGLHGSASVRRTCNIQRLQEVERKS